MTTQKHYSRKTIRYWYIAMIVFVVSLVSAIMATMLLNNLLYPNAYFLALYVASFIIAFTSALFVIAGCVSLFKPQPIQYHRLRLMLGLLFFGAIFAFGLWNMRNIQRDGFGTTQVEVLDYVRDIRRSMGGRSCSYIVYLSNNEHYLISCALFQRSDLVYVQKGDRPILFRFRVLKHTEYMLSATREVSSTLDQ